MSDSREDGAKILLQQLGLGDEIMGVINSTQVVRDFTCLVVVRTTVASWLSATQLLQRRVVFVESEIVKELALEMQGKEHLKVRSLLDRLVAEFALHVTGVMEKVEKEDSDARERGEDVPEGDRGRGSEAQSGG